MGKNSENDKTLGNFKTLTKKLNDATTTTLTTQFDFISQILYLYKNLIKEFK